MPEPDQIAFEQATHELGLPLEPGETPARWAFRYAAKRDAEQTEQNNPITFLCPVCAFPLDDPPVDFNICPCCGTEFEYHDQWRTHTELRSAWIESGMQWWSTVDRRPANWNALAQLSTDAALQMFAGQLSSASQHADHADSSTTQRQET